MEEAIVKAQTAEEIAKEILYYPVTNGKSDESIQKGVQLIQAYDQFKPKWIISSERLPKEYGDYIIYGRYTKDCPKTVDCAYFSPKSRRFTQDGIISKDVTHWMELPKPPTI